MKGFRGHNENNWIETIIFLPSYVDGIQQISESMKETKELLNISSRFLFNCVIFILWMAPPPYFKLYLGLQSNCWLWEENHAITVCINCECGAQEDPPLTVTTHHHHPHGCLCNAQPSELSAALVTASNKSFYFSLLAGWCRAVNGTSRNNFTKLG